MLVVALNTALLIPLLTYLVLVLLLCVTPRAGELQGATLAQLVAEAAAGGKPRLFVQDYWDLSAFWEEQAANGGKAKGKEMVQHAGRALFYLQK